MKLRLIKLFFGHVSRSWDHRPGSDLWHNFQWWNPGITHTPRCLRRLWLRGADNHLVA